MNRSFLLRKEGLKYYYLSVSGVGRKETGINCDWSVWTSDHFIAFYVCHAVLQHDRKSIQYNFWHLFISNFKVIRSSVVQKMELIKDLLSMKQHTSELAVNTAELKGDLDLAKTQIGMTESLLKALSPSDTLEIFTKLEVVYHKLSIFYNFVNCFYPGHVFISDCTFGKLLE